MKTSELTGRALDWAVAQSAGHLESGVCFVMGGEVWDTRNSDPDFPEQYSPPTNWSQAGPIIERERIGLKWLDGVSLWEAESAYYPTMHGPTPLIAAMRCYVASRLGDEVELPEELR